MRGSCQIAPYMGLSVNGAIGYPEVAALFHGFIFLKKWVSINGGTPNSWMA